MTDQIHALLGDQYRYDRRSGEYYAKIHQEMAETINRIWPNLSLAWIPPSQRTAQDQYPFALVETDKLGQQHLVCNCTEEELPLLMERIWAMNSDRIDILSEIDKKNAAIRKQIADDNHDQMMEAHDKLFHMINGKFTYRIDGKKVIK